MNKANKFDNTFLLERVMKMGLALMREREKNGYPRKEFVSALLQIGDTARISEQKLALQIDKQIEKAYQKQRDSLVQTKLFMKKLKKRHG
jgi:hypothetical protein